MACEGSYDRVHFAKYQGLLVPAVRLEGDDATGPWRDVRAVGGVILHVREAHGEFEGSASDDEIPARAVAHLGAGGSRETFDAVICRREPRSIVVGVADDQCSGG
jgi:hypothetical protein